MSDIARAISVGRRVVVTGMAGAGKCRSRERFRRRPASPIIVLESDPGLLAALPQLPLRLAGLPEHLQRSLYTPSRSGSAITGPRHEVTSRVTIRADSLKHINGEPHVGRPRIPKPFPVL